MTRALVVDDVDDVRLIVREALGYAGIEVEESPSGAQALQRLRAGPWPDVVILDIQMADLDGWDTLAAIRSSRWTAAIPVVVCTVRSAPEDAVRGFELGCDVYLTKPFDVAGLAAIVERLASLPADARHQLRELGLLTARAHATDGGAPAPTPSPT
jgi:two-component system OmpR family response regulator